MDVARPARCALVGIGAVMVTQQIRPDQIVEYGWVREIDLPLTSLTDWTNESGTWTTDANGIHQTSTAAVRRRLTYRGIHLPAEAVVEVEMRVDGTPAAGVDLGGLMLGVPDAGGSGAALVVVGGTTAVCNAVYYESDSATAYGTDALAATIAHGTWLTLRVHLAGAAVVPYVNGERMNRIMIAPSGQRPWLALDGAVGASFRNLKVWTPTLP